MGIRLKYDAAALPMVSSGSEASRRFGQGLVLQQRKYDLETKQLQQQQSFQNARDWENRTDDLVRDERQKAFIQDRDAQNFQQMQDRDAQNFGQQKQLMEQQRNQQLIDRDNAMRLQADEQARQARRADIAQGIANGEFDPVTARELKDLDIAEIEAMGTKGRLDAGQQAESRSKFDARYAELLPRRKPAPAPPNADQRKAAKTTSDGYLEDSKGNFNKIPQEPKAITNATEAFAADPGVLKAYEADAASEEIVEPGKKIDWAKRRERAKEIWHEKNGVPMPAVQPAGPAVGPAAGGQPASPLMVGGAPAQVPPPPAAQLPVPPQAAPPVVPNGTALPATADTMSQPQVIPKEMKTIWDARMPDASADDKAEYEAVQKFASQGQPPEVVNAIMVSYDLKSTKEEKLKAMAFLRSKGVDLNEVIKKNRKPAPVAAQSGIFESTSFGP